MKRFLKWLHNKKDRFEFELEHTNFLVDEEYAMLSEKIELLEEIIKVYKEMVFR